MSDTPELKRISETLERIATLLSRAASPQDPALPELGSADAYHWSADGTLFSINRVNRVPVDLLMGIDDLRDLLLRNTLQFARGHGANNALLWGARGMGKSSLVKAIHAHVGDVVRSEGQRLVLIEINREDIETLPRLMRAIATWEARVIVFCDDLSFDRDEASYKSLKTILDGGLEGRPDNVVFYATSNRRHLMPRDMIDNERTSAINPNEAIDEKISLSDRFGLWLGFHHCDQDTYLKMIRAYVEHYGLEIGEDDLRARAIEWAAIRGGRSGRVAIQFVRDLAGELGRAV